MGQMGVEGEKHINHGSPTGQKSGLLLTYVREFLILCLRTQNKSQKLAFRETKACTGNRRHLEHRHVPGITLMSLGFTDLCLWCFIEYWVKHSNRPQLSGKSTELHVIKCP